MIITTISYDRLDIVSFLNQLKLIGIVLYIHGATLTPYGLFGIGRPAKKILTECRPGSRGIYSQRNFPGPVCLTDTGTASCRPRGSTRTTSARPLPASI
jgi:hypothetical protein